jgi:hypothetical protein
MTHRILSLDGGGTWALLQALALRDIYGDLPGLQILADFDLAVANSGGSIVLAGLVENKTPSQIFDLFGQKDLRSGIFADGGFIESLLSHIPIFPKYSTAGKLKGLTAAFGAAGATPLSQLPASAGWPNGRNGQPVKILIVSFDYDATRSVFFRSYGTPLRAQADDVQLVQAVHASSDAPVVYFDAPAAFGGHRYWDGAMSGLNNPLMAGVTELLAAGVPASDIVALSIGTGTVRLLEPGFAGAADANLTLQLDDPSVINDLKKAAGCINDDPPDNASYTAHVVLTGASGLPIDQMGRVVRLSPVVRPVWNSANNVWRVPAGLQPSQFEVLKTLAMDAVDQDKVDLITTLGESWIAGTVPNQPIRMASLTLDGEPGDDDFPGGKARWKAFP